VQSFQYKAFISYSHQDRTWAAWLQRALERYRVPRRLVGASGAFGPIPRRLAPVFRDREDLSSASDLSVSVKESLEASETMIVICSPAAVGSDWVAEEVRYFQSLGREDRVFALIVDGDPQAPDPAERCFPSTLTTQPDGTPREPLAADARPSGDGKLLAKLKIIAGILGIRLDELRRRDMQRRQRLWMMSMGGALSIAIAMTVLALAAISARKAAENRREHAENLVGYMVGDLKTKLDEVGRLDILEGLGGQVGEYLQTLNPDEVTDESLVQQARVWRQLGEVNMDQADLPGALEAFVASRDILLELHRRNRRDAQFVYELGNAEFWVGYVLLETGDFDSAEKALNDYLAWAYLLNELEPGNPEWLMEKSYAHSNLAALVHQKGGVDLGSALVHIEQASEFNRQVLELAPENTSYVSEYGETLAWLADIQLLACDLGGALGSRQENLEIARRLIEGSPANTNFKSRYAFSLTGLSIVEAQIGLVDMAAQHMVEAREALGQLSLMDPSNVNLRFDYFMREYWVAELLADQGSLDEAIFKMHGISDAMYKLLEAEQFSNHRRYSNWIAYLLTRADMARRSGAEDRAVSDLEDAVTHLYRLLEADPGGTSIINLLHEARFQVWERDGRDLFADGPFASIDTTAEVNDRTCNSQVNQVRSAIITGRTEWAAQIAARLLASGYYKAAFVRVCSQYGLCGGNG
jgi:tetratricopeptide (TPR) repeat protein